MNVLKVSAEIKRIDLIYTLIFHIPIVFIVYLNLNVLFPVLLEKGKYFLYGIFVLIAIAVGSGFYIILFDKAFYVLLRFRSRKKKCYAGSKKFASLDLTAPATRGVLSFFQSSGLICKIVKKHLGVTI